MNEYDVGDLVRITGTLANSAGTATDPSGTITFKVRDPGGTITTLVYGVDDEVVKSSTGVYYTDVALDEPGTWHYRVESGTGTGQAADEDELFAKASVFD